MQQTCGNCGQLVGASDATCPYCDALLAAYASPVGVSPADMGNWSVLAADADQPDEREEPALASEIDGLDYAQPPSQTKPHPVLQTADPELVICPADESPATLHSAELDGSEPGGEVASPENRPADVVLRMRPGFWKEPAASNYDGTERTDVEAYLRKLHAATEFESAGNRLTESINAYNPVPRERSIIESIFSWSEKEESEVIVGRTLLVLVPGAMVLQVTGVVDFPLANLIIVLVLVGSFVFSLLKNLDS